MDQQRSDGSQGIGGSGKEPEDGKPSSAGTENLGGSTRGERIRQDDGTRSFPENTTSATRCFLDRERNCGEDCMAFSRNGAEKCRILFTFSTVAKALKQPFSAAQAPKVTPR